MLRAVEALQQRIFANQKIEVVWNSVLKEIVGKDKVKAIKILNLQTNQEDIIECEGVFVFVGFVPNTDFVKNVVSLDKNGYINVDDKMATTAKGIFACGDCRQTYLRQIVTACGDGALAAFSAGQYVADLKGTVYRQ